ncbi:MFS transporter [Novosphingobium bradum]|uniref:MFS transporter n=1 Tax=Novosphingobium bradum TaxID=1737444 RepID=A0ABV7ITN3_9SPHN
MSLSVTRSRPRLSGLQLVEMNLGFLGLQFSFGLQQGNMGPIYSWLGAHEGELPILSLAGPVTGLIVQPLVGALSDRTGGRWGQRTPWLVAGALLCALALFWMPLASSLVMAASLLWLLDAGNNMTMEPYRAYVADRLTPDQRPAGFLVQSALTGLAQMLALATPVVLVGLGMSRDSVDAHGVPHTVRAVFWLGSVLSLATILFSLRRVPELPLARAERERIAAAPRGLGAALVEVGAAIRAMPAQMWRLALMNLFQWFALWGYWHYAVYAIARRLYGVAEPASPGFRQAVLTYGAMAAAANAIAFVSALAMIPLVRRLGPARLHAACLVAGGMAMLAVPQVAEPAWLALPALGIGLAWGSIMGNPLGILAAAIPPARTGVYMGIFNMMIVIPMLLFALTMARLDLGFAALGLGLYDRVLGGEPFRLLAVCGGCMMLAALASLRLRVDAMD